MNVGSLVEFLEDALRPHLPAPIVPTVNRGVDWRSLADRIAGRCLSARGFVEASVLHDAMGDGLRVRVRHECGAWCCFFVDARDFLYDPGPGAVRALYRVISDRAGCYCVPREVVAPCTAQRCEAAS